MSSSLQRKLSSKLYRSRSSKKLLRILLSLVEIKKLLGIKGLNIFSFQFLFYY